MEGGRGNNPYSFYGNLGNDHNSWLTPSPPSTAIDKFLWTHQQNNYLPQQSFFNNVTNIPPHFHPNSVFTAYSTAGGGSSDYIGRGFQSNTQFETKDVDGMGVGDRAVNDWHEDDDNVNSDSSPAKSTLDKRGGSSTPWIKGQWSVEEDRKLIELVEKHGIRKWALIAEHMVGRIGKQCRERWQNHLRPDIKKDHWSEEEERLLIEVHERVGNKWAEIAKCIPGKTENSIKNHWNATKRKQVSKRKIKKPESLNGIKQSVLLEEYIKKKCFNNGSSTSTNSTSSASSAPKNSPTLPENSVSTSDDEWITYLAFETYREEMDFMKNLFGNKEYSNNGNLMNSSTVDINSSESNSSSTNIPGSTPMTDVQMPLGQIGNNTDIPGDAILYPEYYFCSCMMEGNSRGSSLVVNQNNHADAMEMDLMEMISSCNFS